MTSKEKEALDKYLHTFPYESQDPEQALWFCIGYCHYFEGDFYEEFKHRRARLNHKG